MNVRTGALMAAALLFAGVLPACSSPCAEAGNRMQVTVKGATNLNDSGSGPQHAKFRAYAIKSGGVGAFNGAAAAKLATGDVEPTTMSQIGRMFPADSPWLTVGGDIPLTLPIDAEDQYSHLGIAILYPNARKMVVPLCGSKAKKSDEGVHTVTFVGGKSEIGTE